MNVYVHTYVYTCNKKLEEVMNLEDHMGRVGRGGGRSELDTLLMYEVLRKMLNEKKWGII